mmetsp:Transcript_17219/g.54786  ORF Transcript_17219/g.54786 Transcript_17219/m.54786 type:complete len:221 (-) Transcript_17219:176-838(-)
MEARFGVKIDVPKMPDPANPGFCNVSVFADSEADYKAARDEIERTVASEAPLAHGGQQPQQQQQAWGGSHHHPHPGMGGYGGGGGGSGVVDTMEVPNDRIGSVLGRQGATISVLERNSGCRIKVQQRVAGNPMRTVVLRGTADQVRAARSEIDAILSGVHPLSRERMPNYDAPFTQSYGAGYYPYAQHHQQQQQQQQRRRQRVDQVGLAGAQCACATSRH